MALLQAYFDESGKRQTHPVISVCGLVAGESAWQRFADDEWPYLLRKCGMSKFHLNTALDCKKPLGTKVPALGQAARLAAIRQFVMAIQKNVDHGIGVSIDVAAFAAMPAKIQEMLGGRGRDPFYFAVRHLLSELKDYAEGNGDKVGVVLDYDDSEAVRVLQAIRKIRQQRPEIRPLIVSAAVADDAYFNRLQAADLLAGVARAEATRRFHGVDYWYKPLFDDFNTLQHGGNRLTVSVKFWDEESLAELGQIEKTNRFRRGHRTQRP